MSDLVTFEKQGSIGIITVNNPPVNALSHGVRKGILDCTNQGKADDTVQAMVLHCAGRTFIAGADITEFDKAPKEPWLDTVIENLMNCPKIIVAAIHGTALGGGLETALGCHYRVAVSTAQVGLPEVKLGILPGAGGTQRLPRLIGPEAAAQAIASGDFIPAPKAEKLGVIDKIIDGDVLAGAVKYANTLVADLAPLRKVDEMDDKVKNVKQGVFDELRSDFAKKARGFEAPQRCIDAVEIATKLPIKEGLQKEKEIFMELVQSDQSKAQRHIFFAEREVSKVPDIPKDTPKREIKSAAVLGAGTMGGGIAMNFANAGIPVTVLEVDQEALDRGIGVVRGNYERSAKKGRITQEDVEKRMGLISTTVDYKDIGDADVVIEAVFEEMEIKKEVFTRLDETMKDGAILATNTSTLDVNEIAAVTKRPEDVIGTHFFSPANVMKLLEIVRAEKTSKEVVATTQALTKTIRKVGVVVGVCDGFVGNRMIHPYTREASFLLEEGALPQQVDKVMYDFGMAMGPFAMSDLAGLDVGWRIRKRQAATRPKDERYSAIIDKICEQGRYGQKTGAGVYKYEAGDRTPHPDPEVEEIIINESKEKGIERREISDDEIRDRLLYALVNEGARILEEGIALRSGDIDIIYIYGYGFPVYRGGPMFQADLVGLDKVYARVKEFHKIHGKLWKPAPLLKELGESGGSFTKWSKS